MAHPLVTVVGSVTMDITARANRLPDLGETVRGLELLSAPGGKGANQAVACARTGVSTALVACRGDDTIGADLQSYLEAESLDLSGLATVPGPTGCGHVQCDLEGNNHVISLANANAFLSPDHVRTNATVIENSKVLLTQLVIPLDTALTALYIARTSRVLTVLNPAPASALADAHLAVVDVLVPNAVEASQLTGLDTSTPAGVLAAAWDLYLRGPSVVIITRANEGAVVVENGRAFAVGSYEVDALDATGAGDAFCGALVSAIARAVPLRTALRLASAYGALATTKMGSYPAIASYADARALIAAQPLAFSALN